MFRRPARAVRGRVLSTQTRLLETFANAIAVEAGPVLAVLLKTVLASHGQANLHARLFRGLSRFRIPRFETSVQCPDHVHFVLFRRQNLFRSCACFALVSYFCLGETLLNELHAY